MDPAQQSELDWQAFRYVAGEMTADEAAAFEERLASDQESREALSRAVELTERLAEAAPVATAVVALPDPARPKAQSVWRRSLLRAAQPLAWMAAGAAAALLVVNLSGWSARPPIEPGSGTRTHAAAGKRPTADAALWARLQAGGDWATPDLARWLEESATLAADEREDSVQSADVPSWIFATSNSPPK